MADPRIARIERGIRRARESGFPHTLILNAALADLRAWQEIAERHHADTHYEGKWCDYCCQVRFPCPDRQAADAAIDRLDALWRPPAPAEGGESRG